MQDETKFHLGKFVGLAEQVVSELRRDFTEVMNKGDLVDTLKEYYAVRQAAEQVKLARKALEEFEDRLSKETIPDLMRAAKVKSVKVEGIGTFGISNRFSCSILPDAKERAYDWLRENGHESLITETVNSSTLSAFAKDMMENEGEELPPELFKVGTQPYTSIRK